MMPRSSWLRWRSPRRYLEYGLLMPFIVIFAGACLGVLVEACVPAAAAPDGAAAPSPSPPILRRAALDRAQLVRRTESAITAVGSLARRRADLLHVGDPAGLRRHLASCMFAERKVENGAASSPPRPPPCRARAAEREAIAAKVSTPRSSRWPCSRSSGMMLFPASNDLITMFVALEILSLPLYLLCGLARRRRLLSQESALKYFLLGALSSAFFLYGAALLYGYSGSFTLSAIDAALRTGTQGVGPAAGRDGPDRRSGCCSSSAPCRSTPGPPTSTPARRPR